MQEIKRNDIHYLNKNGYNSCTGFLLPSILLNPKLTDWLSLKKFGFINCYLYDETSTKQKFYTNSLLIILNPSISFYKNDWGLFEQVLKNYPNFITTVDYDNFIIGVWFRIHPDFKDVKTLFKRGQFSKFPEKLIAYLPDKQKKICLKDKIYQKALENKLGLIEGHLDDMELCSKPEPDSYTFMYVKEEKE